MSAIDSRIFVLPVLFLLAGATGPQSKVLTLTGASPGDLLGTSVSSAGDVDLDGVFDILVGARSLPGSPYKAGAIYVFSGSTGVVLLQVEGLGAKDYLGQSVAGVGDIDGDGVPDLLAGAPEGYGDGFGNGYAQVLAGSDGAILITEVGESFDDRFGMAVCATGDVDLDGFPDFAVGASYEDTFSDASGTARIFSGKTGAVLLQFDGDSPSPPTHFGESLAAGDVDLDGVPDLLVGAWRDDPNGVDSGSASLFSGASGAMLQYLKGDAASDTFGAAVAVMEDTDGDAVPELVVGATQGYLPDDGYVRVCSGASGAELLHLTTPSEGITAGDNYGWSVAAPGDVSGDGVADVLVGARFAGSADVGAAFLHSGVDGSVLFQAEGDAAGQQLGTSVAHVGDLNSDGVPDFAIGAPASEAGSVQVFSGSNLPLVAGPHLLSVSQGGTQTFQLAAGADSALMLYFLAGTASGTSPGLTVGDVAVPLTPDGFFLYTVNHPNQDPYTKSLGFLSKAGKGTARLTIPPGTTASLVGVELNHAFLLWDVLGGGGAAFASNAVPVGFVP